MGKWERGDCYQEVYFQPKYYEVDTSRRILIPCMLRYMQETALQQIIRIGLSYWDMQKYKVTWIFRRGQLRIYQLPELGQAIRSLTYASSVDKFLTYRDFKIFDNKNKVMATLATEWVLVNYETNKICRIEDVLGEIPILETDDALIFKPFKIKPSGPIIHHDEYLVRKFDLDFNGHTNNATYSEWIMESLPPDYECKTLVDYNIHFKKESLINDIIRVEHRQRSKNKLQHTILKSTGEIVCVAESWYD